MLEKCDICEGKGVIHITKQIGKIRKTEVKKCPNCLGQSNQGENDNE